MQKTIKLFLLLSLLLCMSNTYAEETIENNKCVYINSSVQTKTISIKTTLKDKNDQVLLDITAKTNDGCHLPISIFQETAYIKNISKDKKNQEHVIEPSTISSGLNIMNTPIFINDKQVNINTKGVQKDLLSILSCKSNIDNIQRPKTSQINFNISQTYNNHDTLKTYIGNGYTLEITADF